MNDLVVGEHYILPLVYRPQVAGANRNLVVSLSGWANDLSSVHQLVSRRLKGGCSALSVANASRVQGGQESPAPPSRAELTLARTDTNMRTVSCRTAERGRY